MPAVAASDAAWGPERARKSNRRWAIIALTLGLVVAVLFSAGTWLPHVWTRVMWSSQRAAASTTELEIVTEQATYTEAVQALGPVSYEAPGFSRDGVPDAAVCVWQNTEFGEVRGMFINGGLVGHLLVFE